MAKQLFRNATVKNIHSILTGFKGPSLSSLNSFPSTFSVSQQQKNNFAKMQLIFSDFQEAFSKFNLITRSCHNIDYYPEIFNVYNKIIIRLYTTNEKNEKILTAKDLYVSHFLNQLQSKTVNQSHSSALEKVKNIE